MSVSHAKSSLNFGFGRLNTLPETPNGFEVLELFVRWARFDSVGKPTTDWTPGVTQLI